MFEDSDESSEGEEQWQEHEWETEGDEEYGQEPSEQLHLMTAEFLAQLDPFRQEKYSTKC